MVISVFVGTSVDGFIARRNGDLDFLDAGGDEPHGYDEFIATIDTIVIGRKTFEKVLSFGGWAYGDKPVVVLSHAQLDLSGIDGNVEQMAGEPRDIASALSTRGLKRLYVDGGETIQAFLRAGLVNRITVSRVPVLIGDGIPLFGTLPHDVPLRHLNTREYSSGLVTSEYEIVTLVAG